VIAALLLQSTLADTISIHEIKPDFVLIVLVLMSFTGGRITGTVFGFSAGWLQDVYSPEFLGLNALCKTIIGFLVGYASGGVIETNIVTQGIVLFFAALFHDVLYFLIYSWGHMHDYVWYIVRYGLPTALYTTVVGLLILAVLTVRGGGHIGYGKRFVSR
jgi:rod shape-determining protein MreD